MLQLNPQIVSTILSAIIAGFIFWLVRKDYLIQRDGIKWLFLAILIFAYGIDPTFNDKIGFALGISYPPVIPILAGMALLLIKLLIIDIERARTQMTLTRLVQKVAILEMKVSDKNTDSIE